MSSTELLAIIGAIGSAVAITWNFTRTIQDRANLKVTAWIGKILPDYADRDYLFITIVNIGRRSVLVSGWGGMKKKHVKGKRGFFITSHGLPRMLKEGEDHMEYTPHISEILSHDLEKICVKDSVGREWKVSRKNIKNLFKEVKKLKSANKE